MRACAGERALTTDTRSHLDAPRARHGDDGDGHDGDDGDDGDARRRASAFDANRAREGDGDANGGDDGAHRGALARTRDRWRNVDALDERAHAHAVCGDGGW